ncbi:MAG: MFS transporter [Proteobacteria bacterium]|nr:MFS transporter [Pseudomonadota bacterium]HQR04849.1 MFS transporter [Rhodocyclaceae bacterium]
MNNPPPRLALFSLACLLFAYILSFVDRNVLAVLVGPVRHSLGISDFEFSLLHGWAFTLFYVILGIPIGWLADHWDRRRIIAIGVFLWSLMTGLCGLAESFAGLFIARIGVGIGEAALSPAAYSLLSDLFPARRLQWATSIFALGIPLGTGASYLLGAWIQEAFRTGALDFLSLPAGMAVWQITFVLVGAPGLLIAALFCFVPEPPRQTRKNVEAAPSLRETLGHIGAHWRAYLGLVGGVALLSIANYGFMAWFPSLLVRSHGWTLAEAGKAFGPLFAIAGTLALLVSAAGAGWLRERGYTDANPRLLVLFTAALALPAIVMPLMPTAGGALALATLVIFFGQGTFGVAMAGLQLITPNRMRAQTSAIALFCSNLFGLGLGATFVALLTDFLFHDDTALRYSMALVSGLCYPLSAALAAWGLPHYRRALREET